MISRGRVGMVGLIVAEASLFAVFVVGGEPLDGRWRLLSWQSGETLWSTRPASPR